MGSHRPGERVAVESVIGCGACRHCRAGSFTICPDRWLVSLDADSDGALDRLPLAKELGAAEVHTADEPLGADVFFEAADSPGEVEAAAVLRLGGV